MYQKFDFQPQKPTAALVPLALPSYGDIGKCLMFALCILELGQSCPWAPFQHGSSDPQLQTFPFSRGQVA